jgi:hypothetical protein
LLSSIASLRTPAAIDFLCSLVQTERPPVAAEAIRALRVFRHDQAIRQRIEQHVESRGDEHLKEVLSKEFGG